MKNKITVISIFLFFSCSINAQENTQEKQERLTRAKCLVKTIITNHADYFYDGTQLQLETPYMSTKNICDKTGNFIVVKTYNKRGTIETWTSFEYEKPGLIKYTAVHNTDGTINVKGKNKNYYDNLGRLSEAVTIIDDTTFIGKTLFTYDNNGNMVRSYFYEPFPNDKALNSPARVMSSEIHDYDNKGRTSEIVSHVEESSSDQTTTFKYGENGIVSEKNENGYTGVYTYSANGLCASIKYYNVDNAPVYVVKYTYEYFSK